ncbi:PEGA domain-containing protein [Thermococcus sp. Bubb.Bath]|uniref:PEGA domain-containing protein n=1 Tax=Thermococcus sp. Bubb.Bath TaxID=1638242 RepID=UPI00143A99B9|nr:PEGA domain-containing protein [Thermococcus sp. Bubb.Bath]NJF25969.1 PEGA domain-containing protein [Thermococcus sp. Bubb.Bath]
MTVKSKGEFKRLKNRKLQTLPLILLLLGSLLWFGGYAAASGSTGNGFFWAGKYSAELSGFVSAAYGDSGLIFTGWLNGAGVNHSDAWLVKLNDDGSISWQKAAEGNYGLSDIEATDGGYIAVGWANGAGISQSDAWIVKLDGDGNVLWQKAVGGAGADVAKAVSVNAFVGDYNGMPWIATFNENGSIVWEKVLKGDGKYGFTSIYTDEYNGRKYYYIVGWANGAGISQKDAWLLKFNENGSKLYWQERVASAGNEEATSITMIPGGILVSIVTDNGTILAKFHYDGYFNWAKFYPGVKINRLINTGDNVIAAGEMNGDGFVMKVDYNGNVLGAVTYGKEGSESFSALSIGGNKAFLGGRMGDNAFALGVPLDSLRIPVCGLVKDVSITPQDVNLTVVKTDLTPEDVNTTEKTTSAQFVETSAQFQQLKAIKELFSVSDPVGDDHGPGTYTYPTNPVFNQTGLFDLTGMSVYETPDSYVFGFHFKNLGGNPWNAPNGFSLQIIEVYLDFKKGGNTSAIKLAANGPGSNVQLDPNHPWDLAFRVFGWGKYLVLPNGTVLNDINVSSDLSTNTILVTVPKKYLNITPDTFVAVLVGSQDGYGVDQWRAVGVNASQWVIGGADPNAVIAGVAPRVMDLLAPAWFKPTQEEQLKSYDANNSKLATVRMVPLSENYGMISVYSTPAGATVSIDGKNVGTSPVKYYLVPAGNHTVKLSMSGYNTYETTITVEPMKEAVVNTTLEKSVGYLTLTSTPSGATVFIDGKQVGTTPLNKYELEPGTHLITLKMSGYQNKTIVVKITAGKEITKSVTLEKPNGYLTLTSTPSNATVIIDGKDVGTTPLNKYELAPGDHTIVLTKEGYQNKTLTVTINPGKETNQSVTLTPLNGYLTLTSDPSGATVIIDGKNVGTTPLNKYELAPGDHTIVLTKEGYQNKTLTVTINPGKETNQSVTLEKIQTTTSSTTTTTTTTTTTSSSSSKKGTSICGPAAIVGLAIVPLLLRKRK